MRYGLLLFFVLNSMPAAAQPSDMPKDSAWRQVVLQHGYEKVKNNNWPPCGILVSHGQPSSDPSHAGGTTTLKQSGSARCEVLLFPERDCGVKVWEQHSPTSFTPISGYEEVKANPTAKLHQPDYAGFYRTKVPSKELGKPGFCSIEFKNWRDKDSVTFFVSWPKP